MTLRDVEALEFGLPLHRPARANIGAVTNNNVYIHEFIDILGHNRARYMHHMTANWCPQARQERRQLCYGVWGTVGATGRWPEVVNMWEIAGWDGLVADFAHEFSHPTLQDPTLADWWAAAASLRRGGTDRIVVPAPGTRSIEELIAQKVRGEVYVHELVTLPVGQAGSFLAGLADVGQAAVGTLGLELVGAFRVMMVNDSECVVIWAAPDWGAWASLEQAWLEPAGPLVEWRRALVAMGADWRRTLMVDAPLSPMRIGRQPEVTDRRPLSEL